MTVDFIDYFWGEKNLGFDVLYHNMKYGLVASKELADYFRERSNIEELNSKQMTKLAKQAGSSCNQGTFAPVWQVLKASSERLATLHMQMFQKVSELVKDVSKYADDLQKKYKVVKENESSTLEVVQSIQSTTLILQKAKDLYVQKSLELERLRRENGSAKDIEKAESKLKKCHDDYKALVDKYLTVKTEFEQKMTLTCRHFQDIEEAHLKQMKDFLNSYSEVMQSNHDLVGQVHSDFKRQCLELSVNKLLEQFVLNKYTGLEKPNMVEADDLNLLQTTSTISESSADTESKDVVSGSGGEAISQSNAATAAPAPVKTTKREGKQTSEHASQHTSHSVSQSMNMNNSNSESDPTSVAHETVHANKPSASRRTTSLFNIFISNSQGFLRSRRDKAKFKKVKKKLSENPTGKEESTEVSIDKDENTKGPEASSDSKTPEKDEEGFCAQPNVTELWQPNKESFYSSSDSDTDDERERKIHVEIKPLSNGNAPISASVDELRATVETLSLSVGTTGKGGSSVDIHDISMKRSQSVSQQLCVVKNNDLLGLNLFQSPAASNASTPTSGHPYAPLQSPPILQSPTQPSTTSQSVNSPTLSSNSRYADLGDLFNEVGEMQPSATLTKVSSRQTPTPTSSIALPRPPSRRSDGVSPRGHMSPNSMCRAESVGSLEFRAAGVSVGASRGPSPLTIGMTDTIPIAVAFHEIVHSYFRGANETMCQVKMSGDMMLSFPAGIVAVLANNPSPAKLVFKLRNVNRLDSIVPNKQLVTIDTTQSTSEIMVLDFIMPALNGLLKRQAEQNSTASYFNVDIVKYQVKAKQGAQSCPFQLVAYWKCEKAHTDLKIDYKYNSHAMSTPSPLLNVKVAVPIDDAVKNMQSKPVGQWLADSTTPTNRCVQWNFTELSQHSENNGVGSIRARFELEKGPSAQSTISAQFNCEGTTLSGVEFELIGPGYRVSLVKRRFVSGKYICDGETNDSIPKPPRSISGGSGDT
ncbi:F-BAR domain only protein 2 isoform X2 [Chrysoperla carnea]|uniref:F-BAR domain only protein 2 isoform X2 n=1 Tax=Chrysoperla carnea TaxID=189513 RepID=UPI001D07724A|nr:F-BAR domain only protein 2 isoform X2 [Chrysoperla carnea]